MADKLPGARAALVDNAGVTTLPFYRYFQSLERLLGGTDSASDIAAINAQITAINAEIASLPKSGFPKLQVAAPLTSQGLLQNGFAQLGMTVVNSVVINGSALQLSGDALAPGNTFLYSTGPTGTKGWNALGGMLAGTTGNIAKTVNADGTMTFDLAPVTDSGAGTFKLITRDSFGRLSGTKAGTTSDVPEGTNLYYTDARADARIAAQKGQPNGLATLDASSKLDAGQLPALAITETFVVASEAAMLALTAQQGDVAVRTDLHDSFILVAAPASTLANWQELQTPVDGVASFNGRTGSVTPASGDYNTTQVPEGTNLYFTAARVLATVLSGLSTATNAAITAADSVLSALGKLQAQITANIATLAGKLTASANLSDVASAPTALANLGGILPGYIDGLQMQWVSGASVTVSSGTAYIPGLGKYLQSNAAIALSGLVLTASTWYHLYLYSNSGTAAVECVTTAPVLYYGTAYQKTGDNTRRYIGSMVTDASGNLIPVKHIPSTGQVVYLVGIAQVAGLRLLSAGSANTTTAINAAGFIASTAIALYARLINLSQPTPLNCYLANPDAYATVNSTHYIASVGASGTDVWATLPVSSAQALNYMMSSTPSSSGMYIDLMGYTFNR